MSVALDSELGAWIAWARQHADRLDPLARDPEADAVFAGPVYHLIGGEEEVSDED